MNFFYKSKKIVYVQYSGEEGLTTNLYSAYAAALSIESNLLSSIDEMISLLAAKLEETLKSNLMLYE